MYEAEREDDRNRSDLPSSIRSSWSCNVVTAPTAYSNWSSEPRAIGSVMWDERTLEWWTVLVATRGSVSELIGPKRFRLRANHGKSLLVIVTRTR